MTIKIACQCGYGAELVGYEWVWHGEHAVDCPNRSMPSLKTWLESHQNASNGPIDAATRRWAQPWKL